MNGHRCCPHHRHHHGYHHHEHEDEPNSQRYLARGIPVPQLSLGVRRKQQLPCQKPHLHSRKPEKKTLQRSPCPQLVQPACPKDQSQHSLFRTPTSDHWWTQPELARLACQLPLQARAFPGAPSMNPAVQRAKTYAVDGQKKPELKDGIRAKPPASSRPPITSALADGTVAEDPASKRDAAQPKGEPKLVVAPSAQPGPAQSTTANLPTVARVASTKLGAALATKKNTLDSRGQEVQAPQLASKPRTSRAEAPVVHLMNDDAGARARMVAAPSKRIVNGATRATNKPEAPPSLPEKRALTAAVKEARSAPKSPEPGAPLIDKTKKKDLKRKSTVALQGPKFERAAKEAKPAPVGTGLGTKTRAELSPLGSQGPPRMLTPDGATEKAVPAVQDGKRLSAAPVRQEGLVAAPQSSGKNDAEAVLPRSTEAPRLKELNDEFEIRQEPPKMRGAEKVARAERPKAAAKKAPAVAVSGRPISKVAKDDRSKTVKAADTAKAPTSEKKSKTEKAVLKDNDDQSSNSDASPTPHVKKASIADAVHSRKAAVKSNKPTALRPKVQAQAKAKPVGIKAHVQDGGGYKGTKRKRYSESSSESPEASEIATNDEAPRVSKGKSGARKVDVAPLDKKPHAVSTKSNRAPPLQHGAKKEGARKLSIQSETEAETENLSVADESPEEAPQKARKTHKDKHTNALPPERVTHQKKPATKKAAEAVVKPPRGAPAVNEAAQQLQPRVAKKSAAVKKEKPVYSRSDSLSYKENAATKKAPTQAHPAKDVAPAHSMFGRFDRPLPAVHKPYRGGGWTEHTATPSEIHTANDFSRRSTVTQMEAKFSSTTAQRSTKKRAKKTLASATGTSAAGTSVAGTTAAPTSRAGSVIDTTEATTAAGTTATTAAGTTQGGSTDGSSGSGSPLDPLKMMRTWNLPQPPPEDSTSKKRMLGALMAVAVLVVALTIACFAIAMIARQALEDWGEAVSAIDAYENATSAYVHRH